MLADFFLQRDRRPTKVLLIPALAIELEASETVAPSRYTFDAKLMRVERDYFVVVPARVSKSIGVRGRVPAIVRVGRAGEFRGTLMPRGGGRHFVMVNGETRRAARIEPGDRVRVVVQPDFAPRDVPIPPDLALALREDDVLADWEALPPGKREHIVKWIEQAVHEATRAKRVVMAVEVALARREKRIDHEARRGGRAADGAGRGRAG